MGWKTAWTPALFMWFSLNLEPHPISHLPPKLLLVLLNTSLPLPSPLIFFFSSSASSMVPPLPPSQYHNTIKISCVSVLLWAEPVLVWPTASTDPVFETSKPWWKHFFALQFTSLFSPLFMCIYLTVTIIFDILNFHLNYCLKSNPNPSLFSQFFLIISLLWILLIIVIVSVLV